jgi:hypothetical protein
VYLIIANNFTLVKAVIAIASIKVELIFFIYALFVLFPIILLILELFVSRHLSFQAFSFLAANDQINYILWDALLGSGLFILQLEVIFLCFLKEIMAFFIAFIKHFF